MKKILCIIAALLALSLCGCSQEEVDLVLDMAEALFVETTTEPTGPAPGTKEETEPTEEDIPDAEIQEAPDAPGISEEIPEPQTAPQTVAYGEYYYDVENVVLYLDTYGELPDNYITKEEARDLGWEGGSVENYQDGAAIGGDRFGNREGLLPDGSWVECDIDTEDENSRGAKRLVFNLEDGLYYFTDDHYESFVEVTVDENGEVVWED